MMAQKLKHLLCLSYRKYPTVNPAIKSPTLKRELLINGLISLLLNSIGALFLSIFILQIIYPYNHQKYIMNHLKALKDLQIIDTIKQTSNKITAKYKHKSASNTFKNISIAKIITLPTNIVKEELVYQQFNKFNIIKCINPIKKITVESNRKQSALIILQDYQIKGDVTQYIDEEYELDYILMINICEGVRQLHLNKIVHFNLKPQNILVGTNKSIKFTDTTTPYLNTLFRKRLSTSPSLYLPHQQINQYYICDKQGDIWSIGVIFIQFAIHRRILKEQANFQSLRRIINQMKNQNIKRLLNGMCCPKEHRFDIDQVIDILKTWQNSKIDPIIQKQKLNTIKMPLFYLLNNYCMNEQQGFQNYQQKKQQYFLNTQQFGIQFILLKQNELMHQILWIIVNIKQRYCFTTQFKELPYNLNETFTSLQQMFVEIRTAKKEYFCFDIEGNLIIKIQAKQQQAQIIQEIKSFQKSLALLDNQNQEPPQKKIEIIQQGLDQQIHFESDQEQDLIKAYETFPQSTKLIKDIKDTIKITSSLQDLNIDLISLQYEYLGRQFTNTMNYPMAKKAYKIARQGFCKKYGSNSEKQMNLLINLGFIYAQEKTYHKAIQCYQKCIFIAKILQDFQILALAYTNWGNICLYQKDYQICQQCYIKAIENYKAYKPKGKQIQFIYQSLSKLHFYQQKYQLANQCIQLCLALHHLKGQQYGIYQFNWAVNLFRLNKHQQALTKFNDSFAELFSLPVKKNLQEIFINQCQKSKLAKRHYNLITKIKAKLSQQSRNKLERLFQNL